MGKKATAIRPGLVAAILLGVLFAGLMAARLGLFRHSRPVQGAAAPSAVEDDTWMVIEQNRRRIGHSHRRLSRTGTGYSLMEKTVMRINTMGMVQDLSLNTDARLNPDLSLNDFDFAISSSLFSFSARGSVKDGTLSVTLDGRDLAIPLKAPIYLAAGILDAAAAAPMEIGDTRTFSVFDPATLGRRPVRITYAGPQSLKIAEETLETRRFDVDFMGSSQSAWVDEKGRVVKEKGFMGITMTRATRDHALAAANLDASEDLTRQVAVNAGRTIPDPAALSGLRVRVGGLATALALNGGRQRYENGVLTVSRETVPDPDRLMFDQEVAPYLEPAPFVESDHPVIRETVNRVVAPDDRPLTRVRKLMAWIHQNIERRPVLSVPGALQTITHRMGDCNEHAVLFAAMARAAGVPAQIEAGLVYMNDRFYYHAWNRVYLGQWITADALMGQMPADATHIRFVQGAAQNQIDLMQVIGRVRFSHLEMFYE